MSWQKEYKADGQQDMITVQWIIGGKMMASPELQKYTEEQMRKLTQFQRGIGTVVYLSQKEQELNNGFQYSVHDQATNTYTTFDQEMYWMTTRMTSKLFDQLIVLGLKDELKEMIEKTHIKYADQAPDLDQSRGNDELGNPL